MTHGFLTIKNWRAYQHYGKRAPTWIKVYRALLDDHSWGQLTDAGKAHLVGLWLLAAHANGQIPCDPAWIARRIGATDPIDLQSLVRLGFVVPDDDASKMLAQEASKSLALCASLEEKRREELSNSLDHLQGTAAPPSGGVVPTPISKPARRAQAFKRAAEEADAFREVALAPPAPGERP